MHPVFTTHLAPTTSRLAVSGELDLASREQLRWRLAQAEQFAGSSVELDLGGVTYVDASCLRVVDDARRRLEASGRSLDITVASRQFAMISSLAGYFELTTMRGHAVAPTRTPTAAGSSAGRRSRSLARLLSGQAALPGDVDGDVVQLAVLVRGDAAQD